MAISFTCPNCNEAYSNLKDELVGKRVTCRNQNCRKIFVVTPQSVPASAAAATSAAAAAPAAPASPAKAAPPASPPPAQRAPIKPAPIPRPAAPSVPPAPASAAPIQEMDAEALALAAFNEEQKKVEEVPQKLSVTCTSCDHTFEVDRSMEGRNTPCPECRKLVKVPLQKKVEAADWRKTDNRDHLKRNEPVLEGVSERTTVSGEALVQAGAVRKVEYEPLPLATRVQRVAVALLLVTGIVWGGITLSQSRGKKTEDQTIAKAIRSIEKSEEGKARTDLQAGIYRLAAEQRLRTVQTKADLDEAVKYLNLARDRSQKGNDAFAERQAELIDIALGYASLGGDAQQINRDLRLKWDEVQKQIRQTLERIGDDELRLQGVRRVARALAPHREAWRAVDVAKQVFPPNRLSEIMGQVGLELLVIGEREQAQEFLKKKAAPLIDAAANQAAPSISALRFALGSIDAPAPLNDLPVHPRPAGGFTEESRLAYALGLAFTGDLKAALELANRPGNPEARVRAYLGIAEKVLELDRQADAALPFLEGARQMLLREGKNSSMSPWIKVRAVYLLARAGKPEFAAELSDTLDKELQPWARGELLRARLAVSAPEALSEDWLPPLADATKPRLAHAVSRERFARHQASGGLSGPAELPALLQPFALLGTALGARDPAQAERPPAAEKKN